MVCYQAAILSDPIIRPTTPGGSKNASGPVSIPLKGVPLAPDDKPQKDLKSKQKHKHECTMNTIP